MGATAKAIAAWNAIFDTSAGDAQVFDRALQSFLELCDRSADPDARAAAKVIRWRLMLRKGMPPARWSAS